VPDISLLESLAEVRREYQKTLDELASAVELLALIAGPLSLDDFGNGWAAAKARAWLAEHSKMVIVKP
jgi:hypothetical protein